MGGDFQTDVMYGADIRILTALDTNLSVFLQRSVHVGRSNWKSTCWSIGTIEY